ncbi:hypothetical protein EVAR_56676_1 [Eumeta japonica]|uniref:Uncharacterized protein n=1 Tax=Eumeta variegata TaxID=151549 RepID=A0A4C1YUD5_EUMVA|nr:hypothetical protein EVAR_56676_1 [Eumeta japonica]
MSCIHYIRGGVAMHFTYFTYERHMGWVHRFAMVPYRPSWFSASHCCLKHSPPRRAALNFRTEQAPPRMTPARRCSKWDLPNASSRLEVHHTDLVIRTRVGLSTSIEVMIGRRSAQRRHRGGAQNRLGAPLVTLSRGPSSVE